MEDEEYTEVIHQPWEFDKIIIYAIFLLAFLAWVKLYVKMIREGKQPFWILVLFAIGLPFFILVAILGLRIDYGNEMGAVCLASIVILIREKIKD